MRRTDYRDMTIGESLNYVHNWLYRTCPICEEDRPGSQFTWCSHHRPAMQLRGERGITISFDKISPSLRTLGLTANRLHSGLRSVAEKAHDIDTNRVQNMFLELDMDSAWQEAGFTNAEDSEAEDFLNRRHEVRRRFPSRDIYCAFEGDRESRAIEELNERLALGMLPGDQARNKCPNCGRFCGGRIYGIHNPSHSLHGNHQMMCRRCSQTVCMGCANDGEDPMQPICYPCQFRWQSTWVAGRSSPNLSQPWSWLVLGRDEAFSTMPLSTLLTEPRTEPAW